MNLHEVLAHRNLQDIPIKAPSDDVDEVVDANFMHGRRVGPKFVSVDALYGGVDLRDKQQRLRVDNLKRAITSESGYISRLIVDTKGNVIEGQHRLEALRELGMTNIPVYVVQEMLPDNIDIETLRAVVLGAQSMHSDNVHQLIQMVMQQLADEGSAEAVERDYEPPRGFEKAWFALLKALS